VSFSNVVRKAKSLLFVRYSNIISIQNNLSGALFQNQFLIGAKEFLSVLFLFARQLILTVFDSHYSGQNYRIEIKIFTCRLLVEEGVRVINLQNLPVSLNPFYVVFQGLTPSLLRPTQKCGLYATSHK